MYDTYHTFVRWAPIVLPVSLSILKSLFSTMTTGECPYAMPRGQVLEVSASCKTYMAYKKRRSL